MESVLRAARTSRSATAEVSLRSQTLLSRWRSVEAKRLRWAAARRCRWVARSVVASLSSVGGSSGVAGTVSARAYRE